MAMPLGDGPELVLAVARNQTFPFQAAEVDRLAALGRLALPVALGELAQPGGDAPRRRAGQHERPPPDEHERRCATPAARASTVGWPSCTNSWIAISAPSSGTMAPFSRASSAGGSSRPCSSSGAATRSAMQSAATAAITSHLIAAASRARRRARRPAPCPAAGTAPARRPRAGQDAGDHVGPARQPVEQQAQEERRQRGVEPDAAVVAEHAAEQRAGRGATGPADPRHGAGAEHEAAADALLPHRQCPRGVGEELRLERPARTGCATAPARPRRRRRGSARSARRRRAGSRAGCRGRRAPSGRRTGRCPRRRSPTAATGPATPRPMPAAITPNAAPSTKSAAKKGSARRAPSRIFR